MAITTISKSTLVENIWKNFFDRLKSNVTSTTLANSDVITIQTYTNSFPDKDFYQKADFPIMIIETPKIDTNDFTFGKNKLTGTLDVTFYTTQSESADKFSSAIIDSIETYRGNLYTAGLRQVHGNLQDSAETIYGQIKVHWRVIRFTYDFYYVSTLQ